MRSVGIRLRESARQHGQANASAMLAEAFDSGAIRADQFDYRGFAAGLIGESFGEALDRFSIASRAMGADFVGNVREQSLVDASFFAQTTGQILIRRMTQKYNLVTQIGKMIFQSENVGDNLQTEIEPRVSRATTKGEKVNQGMPYPAAVFGQHYVTMPAPVKFGEELNVTLELVIAGKNRQINESADSVAEMVGWYEEEDKLRTALGINNDYSENGTAFNTYRTSGSVINKLTDFTLVDHNSVNRLEQTLQGQTDPATGLTLDTTVKDLVVMPLRKYTARRIFDAVETRSDGTSTGDLVVAPNPLDWSPNIIDQTRRMRDLMIAEGGLTSTQTDTLTIAGDFAQSFVWREVYPTRIVYLPPGSEREFSRDIVLSVAGKGFGKAAVREPRTVVMAYQA